MKKKQRNTKSKVNKSKSKNNAPSSQPPDQVQNLTFNQWADKGHKLDRAAFHKAISELKSVPNVDRQGRPDAQEGLIWYEATSKQDLIQKFRSLQSDEARAFFTYQQREIIRRRAQLRIRFRKLAERIEKDKNTRPDELERMLTLEL